MADRITIQGISGSGKTTLAATLAERLGLHHIETDALVHGPGWTETSDDELRGRLEELMAGGRWVIDADYRRKIGTMVLERAQTVVWLDLPLHVCLRRLWRRTRRRMRRSEELWNGNRESWRGAFWGRESLFVFAIRKHFTNRRTLPELFAQPPLRDLEVVRLRSPDAVERWLEDVAPTRVVKT